MATVPGRRAGRWATLATVMIAAAGGVSLAPAYGQAPTGSAPASPRLEPGMLWLRVAAFDPLRDGEPELAAPLPAGPALRAEGGPRGRYAIVQLDGPATPEVRRALREAGAEIVGYVPDHAFVVRVDGEAGPAVFSSVPGLRFAGPFRPAYKLSSDLARWLASGEGDPETADLDVLLFSAEAPGPLLDGWIAAQPWLRARVAHRADPVRVALEGPRERLLGVVGSLIRDPAVAFVERHLALELDNDESVWIGQSYDRVAGPAEAQETDPKPYAQSATLWNRGLTGAGQVVAVADTGLEYGMCFFDDPATPLVPQSVAPPGPLTLATGHRKILAVNGVVPNALANDGSFRHGTHVAGSVAGDDLAHTAGSSSAGHDHGDGMAPEARLVFEDVGAVQNSACSTSITVPSIGDLLDQEYAAGARISTNSWGSGSGNYNAGAAETDDAAWRHEDLLVIYSAGNSGAAGVNDTASCKNCLAVGAAESWDASFPSPFGGLDPENLAAFSSRGPAADGRIKPNLTAPGYLVYSARFPVQYVSNAGDPSCVPGDPDVCFPSFGGCYVTDSSASCNVGSLLGTSMAAPTVAGLAALARQYFTDGYYPSGTPNAADARVPSGALLRAILQNGARNMTGHIYERRGANPQDLGPMHDAPSGEQGWGRVMLDDALYFQGDTRRLVAWDISNTAGLATGQTSVSGMTVTDSAEPLEATLTWTDPPAMAAAGAARVNDLDLELTAPDGTLYGGNQWTSDDVDVPGDKSSMPNAAGRDSLDTVEGILVPSPTPGPWTARVIARDVPGHEGLLTQGFALVVTGAVLDGLPGYPPPVPDGSFGDAMRAARTDEAGDSLDVTWDSTTCPAAGYHLLYGSLAAVGALEPEGAVCGLGTTGSYPWTGVPADDLWFVVVGDDLAATEGTWGAASDGSERAGSTPSGRCAMALRDNSAACP